MWHFQNWWQIISHTAAAKSLQSCLTLCDPIDSSPPGSPVPGILQARTLEWVAISFSNVWKWKVKVNSLSRFRFLVTPWTAAYQAPPSMGFSRQEYWSGLPLPSLINAIRGMETSTWRCKTSVTMGTLLDDQCDRWHHKFASLLVIILLFWGLIWEERAERWGDWWEFYWA